MASPNNCSCARMRGKKCASWSMRAMPLTWNAFSLAIRLPQTQRLWPNSFGFQESAGS